MKILVTGGAGFIGSHIVDALVERGHTVLVYDDLSSGKLTHLNSKATFIQANIQDSVALAKVFEEHDIDAIFHLAAQISVLRSMTQPTPDAETNIMATLSLLDLAAKHHVKKFIFSSTGGVMYGDTELRPTSESHPENPLSPYAITKLSIDKYLTFYREVHGMQTVSLRYGNVYGPRQNPHGEAGVVAIFLSKMFAHEEPLINGDGKQSRDYVYVSDIVEANMLALETDSASGVYNIGTGKETSVNQLFQALNTFFDNSFQEIHGEAKRGEQQASALDASRAHTELGWSPKVTFINGLKQTFESFQIQK